MQSERTIDLNALLQQISGEAPTGANVRGHPELEDTYHTFKDARADARSRERRMFERLEDPSEASAVLLDVPEEWATVRNTAEELLRAQTKDLEIAAGLTEALVRRNGFPGLRDGFDLIFGLVDRFWDSGLYPPPEDEGARDTVAPIAGLNGEATEGPLLQHVRNVPLTERNTGVYAFWHQRMVESGSTAVTSLEIEAALGGTSGEKLKALSADLAAAAESLAAVDTALTNVLGRDAPSVRRVQEELEAIQAFLHRTVGSRIGVVGGGETPAASIATASGADTVVAEAGASRSGSGSTASSNVHPLPSAIRSREEAFETLQKVALYFRQAEPHSPMSYVLDELVRRGQLSFPELMQELIPDQTTRWDFLTRMGIQPEQHDPESTGL